MMAYRISLHDLHTFRALCICVWRIMYGVAWLVLRHLNVSLSLDPKGLIDCRKQNLGSRSLSFGWRFLCVEPCFQTFSLAFNKGLVCPWYCLPLLAVHPIDIQPDWATRWNMPRIVAEIAWAGGTLKYVMVEAFAIRAAALQWLETRFVLRNVFCREGFRLRDRSEGGALWNVFCREGFRLRDRSEGSVGDFWHDSNSFCNTFPWLWDWIRVGDVASWYKSGCYYQLLFVIAVAIVS